MTLYFISGETGKNRQNILNKTLFGYKLIDYNHYSRSKGSNIKIGKSFPSSFPVLSFLITSSPTQVLQRSIQCEHIMFNVIYSFITIQFFLNCLYNLTNTHIWYLTIFLKIYIFAKILVLSENILTCFYSLIHLIKIYY